MKKLSIFHLARQNIKRRVFQNLVILGAVGLAIGTLFTASMLLTGVKSGIQEGVNSLGADIMVLPQSYEMNVRDLLLGEAERTLFGGGQTDEFVDVDLMKDVARVEGVKAVSPQLYVATWDEGSCSSLSRMQIIGFDPKTDFIVQRLIENKYVHKEPFESNEIFLGYNLTAEMEDYEVIQKWPVYGYNFRAIGKLKKTNTPLDWSLFVPLSGIYTMAREAYKNAIPEAAKRLSKIKEGMVSKFLVRVDTMTANPKEIGTRISREVPDMTVVSTAMMVTELQRQLIGTIKGLAFSGLIVWLMSVLVVGIMFSAAVNERQREIGLLRAMGFRRSSVFRLIIYESSVLTSLGAVLGLIVAFSLIFYLSKFFQTTMKMPFLWPSNVFLGVLILICLAAGLASGLLGGMYPAARSSMMEPLEAIRKGE